MLKRFFIFLFICLVINVLPINASEKTDLEISNRYFSFTMPAEMSGTYSIDKFDNGIYVCEKISKDSDLGGYAFALKIFRNPSDYAGERENKKIGELKDTKGIIYDMVLMRPNEIQYGEGEKIKENYDRLYDFADKVEIKGINGNRYVKNQGMKGEDLYSEIVKKHKIAIEENWTPDKYKQEKMSSMYNAIPKSNGNLSDKIGYSYYDINSDGIDELFIGEITNGRSKGIIYDMYTMVDRKPKHVVSGSDSVKYFVCNDVCLRREYSPSSKENSTAIYTLGSNSALLDQTIKFIYNAKDNKRAPWFIEYGNSDKENVSKKLYKAEKNFYNEYKRFNYIPLSQFK